MMGKIDRGSFSWAAFRCRHVWYVCVCSSVLSGLFCFFCQKGRPLVLVLVFQRGRGARRSLCFGFPAVWCPPVQVIEGGNNKKQKPAYGADVLRLWVSSVDYSGDVCVGDHIIKQVRRILLYLGIGKRDKCCVSHGSEFGFGSSCVLRIVCFLCCSSLPRPVISVFLYSIPAAVELIVDRKTSAQGHHNPCDHFLLVVGSKGQGQFFHR